MMEAPETICAVVVICVSTETYCWVVGVVSDEVEAFSGCSGLHFVGARHDGGLFVIAVTEPCH